MAGRWKPQAFLLESFSLAKKKFQLSGCSKLFAKFFQQTVLMMNTDFERDL